MTREKSTWEPTAKTQELSKFLYRAPEPIHIIPFILLFSLLCGLLIEPGAEGLTYGLLLIGIPAFLSAWSSTIFVRAFGGKFYFRRSFLTSFIGVLFIGCVLLGGLLVRPFLDIHWRILVIYGYSLVLSMRYLVLRSTCLNYHRYSFIISSAQTFFAFLIHILLSLHDLGFLQENNFLSIQESSFGILSSFFIFLASLLFIEIVNAPLETDVGISGTDLLGYFLSYMIEGTKETETLFLPLQEEFNIPFSIMAVRKRKKAEDTESADHTIGEQKPFHALIICPSIHPGPVGTIGGGNLPSKLAEPLKDLADHILVPHGPATNDNNPATSDECDKVVESVRRLAMSLKDGDFANTSTPLSSKQGETTIHLQRFGRRCLIISEPIPYSSDDITPVMFEHLLWAARYQGFQDIMLIDAHNNSRRGSSAIHMGDQRSMEIETHVEELIGQEIPLEEFSIGFGSARPRIPINGIGPKGAETMVHRSDGKTTAFILFDGNNMLSETREALRQEAETMVDRALVLTADNHMVNATMGGYNPVGLRCTLQELIPLLRESLEIALNDAEASSVAIKSGFIEGINILGIGNTNRLVATINSTIAILKRAAISCILLAVVSSALLYSLIF